MRSVEIFAGAGGLAIGMAQAGFHHMAVIERDPCACNTFRDNQRHHENNVENWPLFEVDARRFAYKTIAEDVDVVSGGPPCQPFSIGGKHAAQRDERNMFPEAVRAIKELRPKAFIFENVKGLTRRVFDSYFNYLMLQLHYPESERRRGERWTSHLARLERQYISNRNAAGYRVVYRVLNAADYGVPQQRQRVFIVGFRSDIGASWSFPEPTHSEYALLSSKWVSGTYWDEHRISRRKRPLQSLREKALLAAGSVELQASSCRWRTVRDAIGNLPDPETQSRRTVANHVFVPGARIYKGHVGSLLDCPSKTLKAGRHGVPGGENMFIKDDGSVRYFTVREAARIQTFPDEFQFSGAWTQTMRQLGNAVPVTLARVIAHSVAQSLRAVAQR